MNLFDQLRAAGNRLRPSSEGTATEPDHPTRPSSSLFRCEACDTVYIATEKDHCSACAEPVESVPSTLCAAD